MLLKKFIVYKDDEIILQTCDVAIAKDYLIRNYKVIAYVSDEVGPQKRTLAIICRKIDFNNYIFLEDMDDAKYIVEGFDNNIRQIKYKFFKDLTLHLKLYSVIDAIKAVNLGHIVVAVSDDSETTRIIGFESEKCFMTFTDSKYTILN